MQTKLLKKKWKNIRKRNFLCFCCLTSVFIFYCWYWWCYRNFYGSFFVNPLPPQLFLFYFLTNCFPSFLCNIKIDSTSAKSDFNDISVNIFVSVTAKVRFIIRWKWNQRLLQQIYSRFYFYHIRCEPISISFWSDKW